MGCYQPQSGTRLAVCVCVCVCVCVAFFWLIQINTTPIATYLGDRHAARYNVGCKGQR